MTKTVGHDPGSGSESGWGEDLPLPLTPPRAPASDATLRADAAQTAADDHADDHMGDRQVEVGGPAGPEPTRYQDWEVKGRCSDF